MSILLEKAIRLIEEEHARLGRALLYLKVPRKGRPPAHLIELRASSTNGKWQAAPLCGIAQEDVNGPKESMGRKKEENGSANRLTRPKEVY